MVFQMSEGSILALDELMPISTVGRSVPSYTSFSQPLPCQVEPTLKHLSAMSESIWASNNFLVRVMRANSLPPSYNRDVPTHQND